MRKSSNTDVIALALQVFQTEIQALNYVSTKIDDGFVRALDSILECKARVAA